MNFQVNEYMIIATSPKIVFLLFFVENIENLSLSIFFFDLVTLLGYSLYLFLVFFKSFLESKLYV